MLPLKEILTLDKYKKLKMTQPLGNLFIIAAPSGAGKSSLINGLIKRYRSSRDAQSDSVQLSVSHTTRSPRPGETNGIEYHFVTHAEFEGMIATDDFYEHAKVFDNYYGTSKAAIADKLNQGIDIFLDIDWQGARQVKQLNPNAIGVFILPPSKPVLHERLIKRGQDSDEVINKRMAQAVSEMSHYNEFDYVIVNEDFEQALDEFSSVVQASRVALSNQQLRHVALFEGLLKD